MLLNSTLVALQCARGTAVLQLQSCTPVQWSSCVHQVPGEQSLLHAAKDAQSHPSSANTAINKPVMMITSARHYLSRHFFLGACDMSQLALVFCAWVEIEKSACRRSGPIPSPSLWTPPFSRITQLSSSSPWTLPPSKPKLTAVLTMDLSISLTT